MAETATILFVDDEMNILASLRRGLIDVDYHCIYTTSGEKALEIMEKEPVNVIVSDMRMPGINGLELLKIVKKRWPHTVRIVLSGYSQLAQVLATVNEADVFRFILKPWKMSDEFLGILESAVAYNQLQNERDELEKSLKKKNEVYQKIFNSMQEANQFYKKHEVLRSKYMEDVFHLLKEEFKKSYSKEEKDILLDIAYDFIKSVDMAQMAKNKPMQAIQWIQEQQSILEETEKLDGYKRKIRNSDWESELVSMPDLFSSALKNMIIHMQKIDYNTIQASYTVKHDQQEYITLSLLFTFKKNIDYGEHTIYVFFLGKLVEYVFNLIQGHVQISLQNKGYFVIYEIPIAAETPKEKT